MQYNNKYLFRYISRTKKKKGDPLSRVADTNKCVSYVCEMNQRKEKHVIWCNMKHVNLLKYIILDNDDDDNDEYTD